MCDLDNFPTYRLTYAYKAGIRARHAGKPITACKCRTPESIADWRMGWRDAIPYCEPPNNAMHPTRVRAAD